MDDSNRLVYDLTFSEDSFNDIPYDLRTDNFVKLNLLVSDRFDKVQSEAISLAYSRLLDNAEGQMVDDIASRFFIDRQGKSDAEVKAAIQLFALRQDSEATRSTIVNLLQIIAGDGGYVKIYKGPNNYIQAAVSTDCLDLTKIKVDLEGLFPINTNLTFIKTNVANKPFGLGSRLVPENNSSKIGALGTRTQPLASDNYAAVTIINNERGR